MMIKLYVSLQRNAVIALRYWAEKEHRNAKQQASWIIEQELKQRGLLQTNTQEPSQMIPAEHFSMEERDDRE